jgi:hypothetical protein
MLLGTTGDPMSLDAGSLAVIGGQAAQWTTRVRVYRAAPAT